MNDDKHNTNENAAELKISALYQNMPKEQPSKERDKAILELAKAHLTQSKKSNLVTLSQWRKWQWPASIAASVIFVSVIFYTQYEQFDPMFSQPIAVPADPHMIAQQSTLDEVAARQRAMLETKAHSAKEVKERQVAMRSSELADIASQQISEPELSKFAEVEAQGLAAKALENVELDINIDEFNLETMPKIDVGLSEDNHQQDELAAMRTPLDFASASLLNDQHRQGANPMALEQITVTGSRIDEEKHVPIESDYLQDLLQKLSKLGEKSELSLKDREKVASIQQSIFDYLSLLKMAEPDLVVEQKYVSVLTQEQLNKLGVLVQDD
jgi:hypothetical protein